MQRAILTRRRFLSATTLSGAGLLLSANTPAGAATYETPLRLPKLIDPKVSGNAVSLTIDKGSHAFRPGRIVESYGYSAPVLGPVIRLARGDTVDVTVENKMQWATTVHWHGLIIPGNVDGGPHNTIASGQTWKASLRVDQPEATAWFHPHPHARTAPQVYSGLAGLIFVEDGTGEKLGLPRDYGVDDFPLIIQDRVFDRAGAPVYRPGPMDIMAGYRGDTVIVNGVVAPVAHVPPGVVRLRLLNGANARFFDLGFSDGRAFHVIASDGGYLREPVSLRRLIFAPGERYEILVDFSGGGDVLLESGPEPNSPMMGMMGGSPSLSAGGGIMRFVVDPAKPAAVSSMPQKLADVPLLDRSNVVAHRRFMLNDMMMGGMMGGMGFRRGGTMAINGEPFEMNRIDVSTKRGTLELWEIGSQMMAHPFHVHGTQFQIMSVNGRVPPLHQQGWKDTVIVSGNAQILVPFTQTASRDAPFMFHCHILEHEDAGMMGQFICT